MKFEKAQIGALFRERRFDELKAMRVLEPSWFESGIQRLLFDQAIRSTDVAAMQFLLDIGYDINEVSHTGTPLSRAASNGATGAIQWLLEHGAKVNESTLATNPLFSAIQGGHADIVSFFLARGVNPYMQYLCGRNALDFARIWNNSNVIAALGGDPSCKRPPWILCSIPDLTGLKPSIEMLEAVEEELGFLMPNVLKHFLLEEFPESLFFPDAKDNDEWTWLGKDHLFFHTSRSLIAYNCIDSEQKKKRRKYKDYFVIGTDGCGNDWCIRTSAQDVRVWSRDHETEEFECEAESLELFAKSLHKMLNEAP